MSRREIDTGSFHTVTKTQAATADAATKSRLLRFEAVKVTDGAAHAPPAARAPADLAGSQVSTSLASRAIAIVKGARARAAGFAAQRAEESDFIPDPNSGPMDTGGFKELLPATYTDPLQTILTADVPDSGTSTLDFKLKSKGR